VSPDERGVDVWDFSAAEEDEVSGESVEGDCVEGHLLIRVLR